MTRSTYKKKPRYDVHAGAVAVYISDNNITETDPVVKTYRYTRSIQGYVNQQETIKKALLECLRLNREDSINNPAPLRKRAYRR